jgi:hypothetical protein
MLHSKAETTTMMLLASSKHVQVLTTRTSLEQTIAKRTVEASAATQLRTQAEKCERYVIISTYIVDLSEPWC